MFKLLAVSCLVAACSVQGKTVPNPAVPFYPQPYVAAAYPQVYSAQPKYAVQPAYVAPFAPVNYRQFVVPANPAYNPHYYGYTPYAAYPQQYPYPYYASNDGTQTTGAGAQPGWGQYITDLFAYVPNFPSFGSESQQPSESQSQGESSSSSSAESSASAAGANSEKGDKPVGEQKPADSEQSTPDPFSFPFRDFRQPQVGQFQQAAFDPAKLNTANNGAISSYLIYRNQPQPFYPQQFLQPLYQQPPQPIDNQKFNQGPASQANQDTAAFAYHRYMQAQKQQRDQFEQGQFQQGQQQDQSFSQQPNQDESSVAVDSSVTQAQNDAQGQQQAQTKLATGPTIAVAQPLGVAFAGIGGRAGAGPIGTAVVGENATAIAGPSATAISLDKTPTVNLGPVHKLTKAYVAKYSPELGVYRVAEIKSKSL